MPPKRNRPVDSSSATTVSQSPTPSSEASSQVAAKPCDSSASPADSCSVPTDSSSQQQPSSSPAAAAVTTASTVASATTVQDTKLLPMCKYGANCYRKNPQHFKEFRHPDIVPTTLVAPPPAKKMKTDDDDEKEENKTTDAVGTKLQSSKARRSSSVADIMASCGEDVEDAESRQKIDDYKKLLEMMLMNKRTISAEKKRVIREVRRENGISDAVHTSLLGKFGWSEDEYEDGEKTTAADDVDLEEERLALSQPDGFSVIWLDKEKLDGTTPAATKARKNVFGRVCMMFFQTMAKAQGNFTVKSVGVIANAKLRAQYAELKAEYVKEGKDGEQWGFHGTSREAVSAIAKTGFLAPSGIKAANKKRKSKKIHVLDSGYFGSGVYFSDYSDYAMFYSDTRGSDEILLCQILPGRSFKCKKRMDGQTNVPGFDSHISPGGNELVIFNPQACLPRYIIRFSQQDSAEREQES